MSTSKSFILSIISLLVLPYAVAPLQAIGASTQGFTISVTDGRNTINAGGTLIYAVNVSLHGDDTETATVQFTLPDYTTIVSPSNGGELSGGKVVWDNLTMSPNSSITLNVQVTLVPQVPNGTTLRATGTVDGISSTDTTVVGTNTIPNKAFKLSITDKLKTVSPTQDTTYTATVKNVSSEDVTTDVHISLGQFVDIVGIDNDAYINGSSITWFNEKFDAGESKTYVIDGTIERQAAEYFLITTKLQAGGVTATDLTSVQTNIDDLLGDNDDDDSEAKIRFSVTPDSLEVLPGGRIRYNVSVRNAGNESVKDLVATVKIDPSVSILVNGGTAEKVNASTLKWNVPTLSAGETWRTSFELALIDGLPVGTAIPVVSTLSGPSMDSITLQSRVSVTSVALIGTLPPTGAPMDTLATFMLMPMAMLAAGFQRRLKLS